MASNFKTMQMAAAARMVVERALAMACAFAGAETVVVVMTPREMGGVEPPGVVAGAMREADAIINQATYSLTHTNAEREALARGPGCAISGVWTRRRHITLLPCHIGKPGSGPPGPGVPNWGGTHAVAASSGTCAGIARRRRLSTSGQFARFHHALM